MKKLPPFESWRKFLHSKVEKIPQFESLKKIPLKSWKRILQVPGVHQMTVNELRIQKSCFPHSKVEENFSIQKLKIKIPPFESWRKFLHSKVENKNSSIQKLKKNSSIQKLKKILQVPGVHWLVSEDRNSTTKAKTLSSNYNDKLCQAIIMINFVKPKTIVLYFETKAPPL